MKKPLIWILMGVLIVAAYAVYRSRERNANLDVEPHAAREIEKAKKR